MAGLYPGASTLYTMSCWNSTGTVQSSNSTTDDWLNQSLTLSRKLQESLTESQIAIPSGDDHTRIEIVVWYKTIRRPRLPDISALLNAGAKALNLTYCEFVEESAQMTCSFTEAEVNNIRRCFKDSGIASGKAKDNAAIKGIIKGQQQCLRQHLRQLGNDNDATWSHTGVEAVTLLRAGMPKDPTALSEKIDASKVVAEPIWLSTNNINKLKMSRGDRLRSDLSAISDAVREIAAATKTGWATFLMVAKGVVTVGSYVKDHVPDFVNLETLEAISVCCSAIGVVGVAAILASVISIITAIVVVLKDCINILVVINNTSSDVTFTGDKIIYGECSSTTKSLPKRGFEFAYAAFYTYRKFHVGAQALGLYGSLFGATFQFGNSDSFSVGMDCPLTIFGGTNSIRVAPGTNADAAAWLAGGCGNEEDKADSASNKYSASARRALGLGNVNWAHLIFDDAAARN